MPIIFAVCGVVSILYGAKIMLINSGTWFFLFWFALGAVLLLAALALHLDWWKTLPVAARRATGIVAGLLLAGFIVTQALIITDFNDRGEEGLDCIVVLGAQVYETGPSPVLQHRLDTARAYLERNPETRCIVSGGQGFNECAAEADVMAAYLIENGISPDRIAIENRSSDTNENMDFSAALLDPAHDRVGIVTNNFHVFRSLALARKAGYAHVTGIAAPSNTDVLPNNLARESLGIAKDFFCGNF